MKKILDKLNKLDLDNKKIFGIILICVIIIYLDASFLIKLQFRGIRTAGEKIIKLRVNIDTLNKDLSRLESLKSEVARAQQEAISSRAQKMFSEGELPLLLRDISDLANKNKVKIMQIRPTKDPRAKEETIEKTKVSPIVITLNLSGTYHSLGRFINALENVQQFISVQDIRITRSPDDYFQQDVSLLLKTYVKK